MTIPDANTMGTWASAIAILIVLVRQQVNAMAGKKRAEGDSQKIADIHQTTMNGQLNILETRATALRTLASLRNQPQDIQAATKAEQDLRDYLAVQADTKTTN